MTEIRILQDYGVYELGSRTKISEIIEQIDIQNSPDVLLDLSGCLLDYPVTSQLIDKLINQMKAIEGKKNLRIELEYSLPPEILADWLFLGSQELNVANDKSLSFEELRGLVEENIRPSDIEIKICIKNSSSQGDQDEIIFR